MSWRPGCPHREAALDWVMRRWLDTGWKVTLSGSENSGPWVRAHDVTPAVEASTADVVVVADADCWTDGIFDAVTHVQNGAAWAVPHLMLCRLSEQSTTNVLAGAHPEDQEDFLERPYKGYEAGTLFVIRRDVYLDCPLDPRFVGWGQEDQALSLALRTLHEKPWRGTLPLWHLFHPPQPRRSRGIGNAENLDLYKRYRIASRQPEKLRALVDEGKAVTSCP